mgnify:CR=1 FL=1
MLAHERLDVYRCSIEFFAIALAVIRKLPRGHSQLADQLRRAAMSIPLNIAEGAGKTTEADQRHFYLIARGSAAECSAVLDVANVMEVIDAAEREPGKRLLERIVAMLTRMGLAA